MRNHDLIQYYSTTGLVLWGKKLEAIAHVAIAPWTTLFPDVSVLSIAEFSFGACEDYESVEAWKTNPPAPNHGWRVLCAWDSYDRDRIMLGESLDSAVEERDGQLILVQTMDWGATTSQRVWQDIHDWSPGWRKPSVKARAKRYGLELAAYRKI
jgi:hypothetical protein